MVFAVKKLLSVVDNWRKSLCIGNIILIAKPDSWKSHFNLAKDDMKGFREFVMSGSMKSVGLDKYISDLSKAYRLLQQMILFTGYGGGGGGLRESDSSADEDEEYLGELDARKFFASNRKFLDHMEKNYGSKPIIYNGYLKALAGFEGVAFFFDNKIVAKVSYMRTESTEMFQTACKLKGKLHLVPVIDCFRVRFKLEDNAPEMLKPVIVMHELDTSIRMTNELVYSVYTELSTYLSKLNSKLHAGDLGEVELEKAMTIEGMRAAGFNLGADGEKVAEDFFVIMREVYGHTGYVLGGDMRDAKNIGLDPKSGRIMPFDLGKGFLRKRGEFEEPPTLDV